LFCPPPILFLGFGRPAAPARLGGAGRHRRASARDHRASARRLVDRRCSGHRPGHTLGIESGQSGRHRLSRCRRFVAVDANLLAGPAVHRLANGQLGWLPATGRFDPRADIPTPTHFYLIDSLLTGDPAYVVAALKYLAMPAAVLGLSISGFL